MELGNIDLTALLAKSKPDVFAMLERFCHRNNLRPPRLVFPAAEAQKELENNWAILARLVQNRALTKRYRLDYVRRLGVINEEIEKVIDLIDSRPMEELATAETVDGLEITVKGPEQCKPNLNL